MYSGVKLGYVFASNAKLKQMDNDTVRNISEVNKFQYGLTLSARIWYMEHNISYYGIK